MLVGEGLALFKMKNVHDQAAMVRRKKSPGSGFRFGLKVHNFLGAMCIRDFLMASWFHSVPLT